MNDIEIQDQINKLGPRKRAKIKKCLLTVKPYQCEKCKFSEWQGQPILLELHHKNGNPIDNAIDNLLLLCPNCHAQTDTFCKRKDNQVDELKVIEIAKTATSISEILTSIGKYPSGGIYNKIKSILTKYNIPIPDKQTAYSKGATNGYLKRDSGTEIYQRTYSVTCKFCNKTVDALKKNQKYCSIECWHNSQKRCNEQYEKIIESVKNLGWVQTGRLFGVSDNALRHQIQRYIKKNNLTISFYDLSKFKKQSSVFKYGGDERI